MNNKSNYVRLGLVIAIIGSSIFGAKAYYSSVNYDEINTINLSAHDITAGQANIDFVNAGDANIDFVKASEVSVETLNANAAQIINLSANDFTAGDANIEIVNAGEVSVDTLKAANAVQTINLSAHDITAGDANIDFVKASKVQVNKLKANNIDLDGEITVGHKINTEIIKAGEAVFEKLEANEATISLFEADSIDALQTYSNELFVGSKDSGDPENDVAVLVASEKSIVDEFEVTDEMRELKNQINFYEKRAELYYNYAKKYAGRSLALYFKMYGDKCKNQAQKLKDELDRLVKNSKKKVVRVGVGTSTPEQTLHISGAMRLEPQNSAPKDAKAGDIYVDASEALCIYLGGTWNYVTGPGNCNGN
jgi:acetolactate synthase regulatory subunit